MTIRAAGQTKERAVEGSLRAGSWLMGIAAVGFIGYAVIFFVRNFTASFLELGIGPNEVSVGKEAIHHFSPSLLHYVSHLHIALSGFIAATGLAVLFLVAYGVRRYGHRDPASRLTSRRLLPGEEWDRLELLPAGLNGS